MKFEVPVEEVVSHNPLVLRLHYAVDAVLLAARDYCDRIDQEDVDDHEGASAPAPKAKAQRTRGRASSSIVTAAEIHEQPLHKRRRRATGIVFDEIAAPNCSPS